MATRINLVPNPSFETNATGLSGATYMNISRVATGGLYGSAHGRCSVGHTAGNHLGFILSMPAENATVYTCSMWLRGIAGRTITIGVNGGGTGSASATATGSWQRLSFTFTSTGTSIGFYFQQAKNGTTPYVVGENLDVDGILLEAGSTLGDYFDGSTTPTTDATFKWSGIPHASTSSSIDLPKAGYYKDVSLSLLLGYGDGMVAKLLVGQNSSTAGDDFHLENRSGFPTAKNAAGALAITNASTGVGMPFWVESVTSGLATVWVKMPPGLDSDSQNQPTLRVWYGGSATDNRSDGYNTFPFFDDFDTTTIDATRWSVSAGSAGDTVSISNSELVIVSDGTSPLKTVQSIAVSSHKFGGDDLAVHYRQRTTTMGNHNLGLGIMATDKTDGNGQFFFRHVNPSTGAGDTMGYARTTGTWTSNLVAASTWSYAEGATNWRHEFRDNNHRIYKNNVQIGSQVTKNLGGPINNPRSRYILMNRYWNEPTIDTGTFMYDYVFTRQMTAVTVDTATAEKQTATGNMLMMFM